MSTPETDQIPVNRSFSIDLSAPGNPFTAVTVDPNEPDSGTPTNTGDDQSTESQELDQQNDQQEQEVEQPDQTTDDDSEVNPYYYLGDALKKEGYLPETLEIDEKIGGSTVYNAYKEKLKEDLYPQVRQEAIQKLEEEGFTSTDLLMARAIRSGVDPRLLQTASMYETFATYPDDSDDSIKTQVIDQMYRGRGFKDEEITKLISSAEADDNIDKLFVESKQFFAAKFNQFRQEEDKRYVEQVRQKEEADRYVNNVIKDIFTKQEVLGEKLSKTQIKAFEDAIRKESETVEVNGTKYKATEMQKFLVEFERSPEMKFLMFKLYKFRDQEKNETLREVKQEVEEDFLKGFKTKVLSSQKKNVNQAVKSALETEKASVNSIMVDLSRR